MKLATHMGGLIGARIPRLEDRAVAPGASRFIDDIALAGVLACGVRAAARIRMPRSAVSTHRTRSRGPGCTRCSRSTIRAGNGPAGMLASFQFRHALDRYWSFALADGETSYVGETVAIVASPTQPPRRGGRGCAGGGRLRRAAAVSDCRKAVEPGAAAVRRELNSNVAASQVAYGDAEAAPARPRTSSTRSSGSIAALPNPSRAAASWRSGATMRWTVWASTQKAHDCSSPLTSLLDFDESRLRVARPTSAAASPQDLRLSRGHRVVAATPSSRDARSSGSRTARAFHPTRRRSATSTGRSTSAVDADGKLNGIRGKLIHDLGAYALQDVTFPTIRRDDERALHCCRALSIDVTVPPPTRRRCPSVRGAGYPQAAFAMERLMDRVARELGGGARGAAPAQSHPGGEDALHQAD